MSKVKHKEKKQMPIKENKKYTVDELIKLGKERNSIKLAKPLYDKEKGNKN